MFRWLTEATPRCTDLKDCFIAAFILLWISDICLTIVGVERHGLWQEYNSAMRWLLEKDYLWFVAVKMGMLYFFLALSYHIKTWVIAVLTVVMVPVVISRCLVLWGIMI